jgi:hypothetical protein
MRPPRFSVLLILFTFILLLLFIVYLISSVLGHFLLAYGRVYGIPYTVVAVNIAPANISVQSLVLACN